MKRKFSFNELLYDERYEKNLIEKVVGLGKKKAKHKGAFSKKKHELNKVWKIGLFVHFVKRKYFLCVGETRNNCDLVVHQSR